MIALDAQNFENELTLSKTLTTSRLVLRGLELADVPAYAELANDRTVADMIVAIKHPFTEADAHEYIAGQINSPNPYKWRYGITLKNESMPDSSGELMGLVALTLRDGKYSLGYWLGRPYRRNGYMSEAVQALITEAFNTREITQIVSGARTINDASQALLKKLGFIETGTGLLRSNALQGSVPVINYQLSLEGFIAAQLD